LDRTADLVELPSTAAQDDRGDVQEELVYQSVSASWTMLAPPIRGATG
jgi:hypothetical protein